MGEYFNFNESMRVLNGSSFYWKTCSPLNGKGDKLQIGFRVPLQRASNLFYAELHTYDITIYYVKCAFFLSYEPALHLVKVVREI